MRLMLGWNIVKLQRTANSGQPTEDSERLSAISN
jgi:hypothetical protein